MPVARAQAHVVARESGGNPLFIDELVRHIQGGEPIDHWEAIGQLDLDEVLWERIRRQPEDAQRLLGTVAVSGRPIRQALAFQAAELGAGGRVALASLRTARLIRLIGQAHEDEIEIYHDRIRETVVGAPAAGPAALAPPAAGEGAVGRRPGRPGAAGRPLSRGGRRWPAASEYYGPRGRSGRGGPGLRSRRAAVSDRAGAALGARRAGAGPCGGSWATPWPTPAGAPRRRRPTCNAAASAPAAETLELKRLASTQLLISGHVDEGLALLRTLLDPLGIRMPETPGRRPGVAAVAPGDPPGPRPAIPPARGGPGARRWS